MSPLISLLCVGLCLFCPATISSRVNETERPLLTFPSLEEKKDAATILSLALASLRSGRTSQLPSLFHPFEVYVHGRGWESAETAMTMLTAPLSSAFPDISAYSFYTLRELSVHPHLKSLCKNLFPVIDQRGLAAVAGPEQAFPIFYLSRESHQDPWAICGIDPGILPDAKNGKPLPASWQQVPSPVCPGLLALPPGWSLSPAPAGEPDQFIPPMQGSPPRISIDSREFSGPISEFSLNWARMMLTSRETRNVRIRLVATGFRFDFTTPEGVGILGVLARGKRLLLFAIPPGEDSLGPGHNEIDHLFSAWSTMED